jgi:hypothetical protein
MFKESSNLTKAITYFTGGQYTPSGLGDWKVLDDMLVSKNVNPQEFVYWYCFERTTDPAGLAKTNYLSLMKQAANSDEFFAWWQRREDKVRASIKSQLYRVATLRNCGLHLSSIISDDQEDLMASMRVELSLEYLSADNAAPIIHKYIGKAVQELIGQPLYLKQLPSLEKYLEAKKVSVQL